MGYGPVTQAMIERVRASEGTTHELFVVEKKGQPVVLAVLPARSNRRAGRRLASLPFLAARRGSQRWYEWAMTSLRLTGRSSSHFTRVARMFAHEMGVPIELHVVTDLTCLDPEAYGGNPALKLPTLHVGDSLLFGTDNICRRLAEIAGREADPRIVLGHHVAADLARSAQEITWHAMSAQVQLVIGMYMAKLELDNLLLAKGMASLHGSLTWLDTKLDEILAALPPERDVSVLEVSLFCLVEHLGFRPTVPVDAFAQLRAFAADYGARASAQATAFAFD